MKRLIAIAILLSQGAFANAETFEFDSSSIEKIEVKNSIGLVQVEGNAGEKTIVTFDRKKFGDRCQRTVELRDTTLFVEIKKTGHFKHECSADIRISAPKVVDLELGSGSGNIKVLGTEGDLRFDTGSGNVEVDANVQEINGNTGSGNIVARGLNHGGEMNTGSGEIKLFYTTAPVEAELKLKTGSGNVEITLPKTAKIRTTFSTGSGRLRNDLGDSPDGRFMISVMTGYGDLHIKTH